jgi:hypothetical protein
MCVRMLLPCVSINQPQEGYKQYKYTYIVQEDTQAQLCAHT